MRIALLTLPSVMGNEASRAFAAEEASRIVLIGVSRPARDAVAQVKRHLARSGPRILPYLALGFGLRRPLRFAQPVITVDDVNGATIRAALATAKPDLIVTLHFDQILSAETIAAAPLGGINLHPSLLPHHRGPIPAFWALAERAATGVSVHRLVPRIDAGAVLAQRAVALPPAISALDAARRLHIAGVPLLRDVVARIVAGESFDEALPEPLPYCPFPDAATLRAAARRGVALVRPRDVLLLRGG